MNMSFRTRRKQVLALLVLCVLVMLVHFTSATGSEAEILCADEYLRASCPRGRVIKLEHAEFGRKQRNRCTEDKGDVDCFTDAMRVVGAICMGRRHCTLAVQNIGSYLGRLPCPQGLNNYAQIVYSCVSTEAQP